MYRGIDLGVTSLNLSENAAKNNDTNCLCSINTNAFKVSDIKLSDTFNPTRIVTLNCEI